MPVKFMNKISDELETFMTQHDNDEGLIVILYPIVVITQVVAVIPFHNNVYQIVKYVKV